VQEAWVTLDESVSMALLIVLEALTPAALPADSRTAARAARRFHPGVRQRGLQLRKALVNGAPGLVVR
jgi:uncharacterized protein YjeT (DUF2065 family)